MRRVRLLMAAMALGRDWRRFKCNIEIPLFLMRNEFSLANELKGHLIFRKEISQWYFCGVELIAGSVRNELVCMA